MRNENKEIGCPEGGGAGNRCTIKKKRGKRKEGEKEEIKNRQNKKVVR